MGKKKGGGGNKGGQPEQPPGQQPPRAQQQQPRQPSQVQQSAQPPAQLQPRSAQEPRSAPGDFPSLGSGSSQDFPRPGDGGGPVRGGRGGGRGRGRGGDGNEYPQQHAGRGGGRGRGRGDQREYPQQHAGATGPSPYYEQYGDGDQGGRGGGRGQRGGGRGQRGEGRGPRGGRGGMGYDHGGRGTSPSQEYRSHTPTEQRAPPPRQARPPHPTQPPQPQPQIVPQPQPQIVPQPPPPAGDQLAQGMSTMSLASSAPKKVTGAWKIPERKIKCDKNNMVGTRGRKIEVEVNHLLLTLKKTGLAIHYDVAFKPDVPKKLLRRAVEEMRRRHFPSRHPAFDGRKNLYSYGELPFGDQIRDTVIVADEERDKPKEFDVTIKRASTVDLNQIAEYLRNGVAFPQDAIQALDIALRNPASVRFTPVGRSYFTPPTNQTINLGNGLELWYGFYQSAVLGWRPFLNVDVAHKGFPEAKSLLDIMLTMKAKYKRYNDPPPTMQQLEREGLQRYELEDFDKFIRGLKCEYMIPNQPNTRRVFKMNGTKKPCSQYRFTLDDGRNITIGEYFERDKRYRLRYPHLPCIHVGPTNKDICLPPELCRVLPGQVTNRKMDEVQTANMVRAAARPADERKQRIMNAMRTAGFNQDPCVNEFGISVADQFQRVNARILDAPELEYGNNKRVRVNKGVWRADKFLGPRALQRWVVLTLCGRGNEGQLRDFARTMQQQGRPLGMNIDEPFKYVVLANQENIGRASGDQLKRIITPHFANYKKEGAELVVVVIPDRPPDTYSKVKLAAEVDVGLLTQCIKERTFGKMNPATAGNILLKINAKLNGVNHSVVRNHCPVIMETPTMLVGADVTHPSPDQTNIPSVAAVAASHDKSAFMYNMIWRLQPPRMEIIQDLQAIMKDQLMFFYQKTRLQPSKIIFYRDGVSEGQFNQVLDQEMTAIRRACQSLSPNYKPQVTFLVVQKRHHTRFFPTRKEDEDGRNKNVPPGTIVDTMITHPKEMDFYLVSHASLQGTSRPTKYHKLWDDNDISEDDLEELTYYLCHLFSRCTRSVSYPAPTYYAHLAAARGRVYLEGAAINLTNLDQEMHTRTIRETIVNDSPMFFV